jgi:hypothetical protein
MSKKTVKQLPEVWKNLSAPDKSVASKAVVIDLSNKVHIARTIADITKDPSIQVQASWNNMEEYLTKTNKQTKLAYHEQFVGEPPKGEDDTVIGYMTWAWFIKNGNVILSGHDSEGNKERKSSLDTRIYTLVSPQPAEAPKTPQAKTCLAFLRDSVKNGQITEADLKRVVETRAAELKTRQDPWRIFQYYRPTLIKGGYLKHN